MNTREVAKPPFFLSPLTKKRMNSFAEYFKTMYKANAAEQREIHSCPDLIECVQQMGFLPLLESSIDGFCAEGMMAEECRFIQFPDGSWEWPLWQWKSSVLENGNCVYGKFFEKKAGFISLEWWPDFYNWRRSQSPTPAKDSIEDIILGTLRENDSMITKDLRAACGFTGPKMRGKFDAYINRLQMSCHIVTENFVYPTDKHGKEYGFGWALLTTPEKLLGREACLCQHSAEESYRRMADHLIKLLPHAKEKQILKLIK